MIDTEFNSEEVVAEKLADAMEAPGLAVPFFANEAHLAGIFEDDAVSEEEAQEAAIDLLNT